MGEGDRYYYSGGVRIPLTPDSVYLVVDMERAKKANLSAEARTLLHKNIRPLRSGLYLLEQKVLSGAVRALLEGTGSLQPTFRHGNTLIAVLPEVRVETSTENQRDSITEFVEKNKISAEIVQKRPDCFVLRPTSGRGIDALRLANRLEEEMHPELAQARFVRIIPKP